MTAEQKNLIDAVLSLSADAQRQVVQFVARLTQEQTTPTEKANLSNHAFVGMWKDHPDLADSSVWVRGVRAKEW